MSYSMIDLTVRSFFNVKAGGKFTNNHLRRIIRESFYRTRTWWTTDQTGEDRGFLGRSFGSEVADEILHLTLRELLTRPEKIGRIAARVKEHWEVKKVEIVERTPAKPRGKRRRGQNPRPIRQQPKKKFRIITGGWKIPKALWLLKREFSRNFNKRKWLGDTNRNARFLVQEFSLEDGVQPGATFTTLLVLKITDIPAISDGAYALATTIFLVTFGYTEKRLEQIEPGTALFWRLMLLEWMASSEPDLPIKNANQVAIIPEVVDKALY